MSSVVISGDTSGSITLSAPAVSGTTVLTLPSTSGTVVTTNTMPTGSVLQVVSTTKTSTFTTTSASTDVDITGFTVTITPSSSSNKILLLINMPILNSSANSQWNYLKVWRGSTQIAYQFSSTLNDNMSFGGYFPTAEMPSIFSFHTLDSPASVSAITYKVTARISGGTFWVNRANTFNDSAVATITAMEIKA